MTTPIEIVREKQKQATLLWESKRIEEFVTTIYAPDAFMLFNGVSSKGQDEILKACKEIADCQFQLTEVDASSPSADCVVLTFEGDWSGKKQTGKMTWKKIDDDWKLAREEWD